MHVMLRRLLIALSILLFAVTGCRQESQSQASVDSIKIAVRDTGLYRLQAADLKEAGFPLSALEDGAVRLMEAGKDVPYHLEDDSVIFYGLASTSRYTPVRMYVLLAGQKGTEMLAEFAGRADGVSLPTVQRTVHLEQNLEYVSELGVGDDSSPWFWQTIGLQESEPIQFDLAAVESGAGQLRARLFGVSHSAAADPDHSLSLVLNGTRLAGLSWDGQTPYTATVTLPSGTLNADTNMIQMQSIAKEFLDITRLDWIEIQYDSRPLAEENYLEFSSIPGTVALEGFSEKPVLVDVSDPLTPTLLSGWLYESGTATVTLSRHGAFVGAGGEGYLIPERIEPLTKGDWESAQQQADLLIVTTDELAPALEPLVRAREEQGLSVALVPVSEIYDAFGHSAATPDGINRFVKYAYQQWQPPAPRYLLLVGDATTDYWGYLSTNGDQAIEPPGNVVPPYLVPVSFGGETVSDARLADVEGDFKPELAVGRWPVDSVTQVQDLVRRTLAYEQAPASERAIFAADGSGQEFQRVTESIISTSEFPRDNSDLLAGPTKDVLASSWREGAWLVTYVGHGSLQLWGKDGMLSSDAVESLHSSATSPIVLQLTCLTGLFAHPEVTSLSEVMLTHRNGPALIIGATSLTLSVHQEPFAAALLQALQDPSVERVGDALQHARQELDVSSTGLREISDTFVLLGDPSARVVRPQ